MNKLITIDDKYIVHMYTANIFNAKNTTFYCVQNYNLLYFARWRISQKI